MTDNKRDELRNILEICPNCGNEGYTVERGHSEYCDGSNCSNQCPQAYQTPCDCISCKEYAIGLWHNRQQDKLIDRVLAALPSNANLSRLNQYDVGFIDGFKNCFVQATEAIEKLRGKV